MNCKKIDVCAFLGESLYGNSVTEAQLLELMDRHGVDRAVVRPLQALRLLL